MAVTDGTVTAESAGNSGTNVTGTLSLTNSELFARTLILLIGRL